MAITYNSRTIVQLDFFTGEYIGEYMSIKEAAEDNFIVPEGLSLALRKRNGKMHKSKLQFMYKEDYDKIESEAANKKI